MDIQKIAHNLHAFVRERFNVEAPIVKGDLATAPPGTIAWDDAGYGDIYSGPVTAIYLALTMPKPDIGKPLSVRFAYALHQWSGQVDQWVVHLEGVSPADVKALAEVFSPTQNTDYWNNHVGPALYVDGVETSFNTPS